MIRAHNGDAQAIAELIDLYTPMIHHIIQRNHYWYQDNTNDLVNDGYLGIMQAISNYDPLKNAVISTWMYCYIRKYLQLGKRAEFNVQVPSGSAKRIFAMAYLDDIHATRTPIDSAEDEDKVRLVSDILIWLNRKFPKHYAEIFYKYFFEDRSLGELNEEYGTQAKQIIYQIKIAIRKKFNRKGKFKL